MEQILICSKKKIKQEGNKVNLHLDGACLKSGNSQWSVWEQEQFLGKLNTV